MVGLNYRHHDFEVMAQAPYQYQARGSHLPLLKVEVGTNVTPAFVWQAQQFQSLERIFFSSDSHFHVLRCKIHFKQLQDAGSFVVTSISINFPDALDATL